VQIVGMHAQWQSIDIDCGADAQAEWGRQFIVLAGFGKFIFYVAHTALEERFHTAGDHVEYPGFGGVILVRGTA
jgi:hypothetical protein